MSRRGMVPGVRRLELIGVPYTSMASPGGVARGIAALRGADLVPRLGAVADVCDTGDLELPPASGVRGRSGLLNERELGLLVATTRAAVAGAHARGRMPLLVGGDCPALLGPLGALSDSDGNAALLMVDGHEDAWPPPLSPTGEASDSELALALGLVTAELPAELAATLPLLDPSALALLGPRDAADITAAGAASLAGTIGLFVDCVSVQRDGPSSTAAAALELMHKAAARFWLHLDLDALSTADFPAADYLQPGGLSWDEWLELVGPALADERCAGASVVIYNPELDPDGRVATEVVTRLGQALEARGNPESVNRFGDRSAGCRSRC